tara:strand:+ start:1001 stop:2263 length:1263 start_codon:yes stop_codon:yes gene_type:complete
MATNMFKNIYEVEDDINQMMSKTALSYGQLDANGYGPMTASTYGQAEMQGRALAGMLGGIDPRMKQAELQAELMKKHPDPRTKADLLAVAKDAALMNLPDVQAQMLEIASAMPDIKKANSDDYKFLTSHMGLTNNSTQMVESYIKGLNPQGKMSDEDYASAIQGLVPDAKQEFNTILNGYGNYLATKGLSPADIQEMAFTAEGRKKNVQLFKAYLAPIKEANTVASYLFNNNVIIESGNGNGGSSSNPPPADDVEITGNDTLVSIEQKDKGAELDFHSESKVNQKLIRARSNSRLQMALESEYMVIKKMNTAAPIADGFGAVGELFMDKETLDYANQLDAVKDWMGGELGTAIRTSSAMKHFQSNPPQALQEFIADPIKYYKEKILQSEFYNAGLDGELGTADDTLKNAEREIPTLWGIN